jgi:hypothetical protein
LTKPTHAPVLGGIKIVFGYKFIECCRLIDGVVTIIAASLCRV